MYIERFLETFTDDALAGLERDARNGTLTYSEATTCLLGHHQLGYRDSQYAHPAFAHQAEQEYNCLGYHPGYSGQDEARCARMLPLIAAEKERRRQPVQQQEEEEKELVLA